MFRQVALLLLIATATSRATPNAFGIDNESPSPSEQPGKDKQTPVDQLIPWLFDEDRQLRAVPFGDVILGATGKKLLAFDPKNEVDRRVLKAIAEACSETVKRLNAPGSAIQKIGRINEVSSHFEDSLRELLNAVPGLSCDFPRTAAGKLQRSGYPDLRIVDLESKRVFYLDPKLFAAGSRDSSFRAFYFEPKIATNKVLDDAVHLVVGFEHQPLQRDGLAGQPLQRDGLAGQPLRGDGLAGQPLQRDGLAGQPLQGDGSAGVPREKTSTWKFTRWDIVDLAHFKVRLKAEFQGSNRDMYRPEAIVATSAK